jgi:hypothetical protein
MTEYSQEIQWPGSKPQNQEMLTLKTEGNSNDQVKPEGGQSPDNIDRERKSNYHEEMSLIIDIASQLEQYALCTECCAFIPFLGLIIWLFKRIVKIVKFFCSIIVFCKARNIYKDIVEEALDLDKKDTACASIFPICGACWKYNKWRNIRKIVNDPLNKKNCGLWFDGDLASLMATVIYYNDGIMDDIFINSVRLDIKTGVLKQSWKWDSNEYWKYSRNDLTKHLIDLISRSSKSKISNDTMLSLVRLSYCESRFNFCCQSYYEKLKKKFLRRQSKRSVNSKV